MEDCGSGGLEPWSLLAVKGLPVTATLVVLAVVIVMVLVVAVLLYHGLARRRNQVDNA